jgi:RNA polymerase-binding transcription factor DksA
MNQQKLDKFRRQLELLQDRLRDVGTSVVEQARSGGGGEATGELSHVPLHLGDRGTEEYLQDMNAVLAENEGYLAAEVREAITRIEDGSFGHCEDCGKAISTERLQAIPFVRHCVKCAEKLQGPPEEDFSGSNRLGPNFNTGRPRKPDDTIAPEGFMAEEKRGRSDVHAVGDAGGGTAYGGLAGSNTANGEPEVADLQDAAGSGNTDVAEARRRSGASAVEPMDYESDEDRERYAEEAKETDKEK